MATTSEGIVTPNAGDLYKLVIDLAAMADSIQALINTHARLRLTATDDLSMSSTNHAFQIGATNNANLAMDANEIMARNNGAPASLLLQVEGGNLTLGNASSVTTIPGRIDSAATPWATNANIRSFTIASGASVSADISYPTGRFTAAPMLALGINAGSPQLFSASYTANSATGFTLNVFNGGGTSATVSISWTATQMTSTSGPG